jgi:hypothetical protein
VTAAVLILDRHQRRPEVIVRWSGSGRKIVVLGARPNEAAGRMFKIERQIRRALRGRTATVEAEIAALLSLSTRRQREPTGCPIALTRGPSARAVHAVCDPRTGGTWRSMPLAS